MDAEDQKRKRNRIAQRKHRQRAKLNVEAKESPMLKSVSKEDLPNAKFPQMARQCSENYGRTGYALHLGQSRNATTSETLPLFDVSRKEDVEQHQLEFNWYPLPTVSQCSFPNSEPTIPTFQSALDLPHVFGVASHNDYNMDIESMSQCAMGFPPVSGPQSLDQVPDFHNLHSFVRNEHQSFMTNTQNRIAEPSPSLSMSCNSIFSEANLSRSPASSSYCSPKLPRICDLEDLGTKFEHVFRAVKEAGFVNFDSMLAQYYTTPFEEGSTAYWAQTRSRSRYLQPFLAMLHESSKNWSHQEARGYRQQITEAAENLYTSEVERAREHLSQTRNDYQNEEVWRQISPVARRSGFVHSLLQKVAEPELAPDYRQRLTRMREMMPETWSLLIELTRESKMGQPQGSQAVFAFLTLLLETERGCSPLQSETACSGETTIVV